MARSRMPCGHCDIGTYSVTPVLNGVAAFRGALTRKEALRRAPMCKTEPRKVCAGACLRPLGHLSVARLIGAKA